MRPAPLAGAEMIQVGVVVEDIEAAASAWASFLGTSRPSIQLTAPLDIAHTEFRGEPTPAQAKLAFIPLGRVTLELIEPVGGPSTWAEHLDRHGESIHHVAYRVQSLTQELEALQDQGIGVLQRGDYAGGRYVYLDSADSLGAIVELLEDDTPRGARIE